MTPDQAPFGLPRRPGSAPRPEGLEAAVREGRRRLRRTATLTAGAALSAVAVLAGVALTGSGAVDDALVVVPASSAPVAPTRGASPAPAPAPAPQAAGQPGAAATAAPPAATDPSSSHLPSPRPAAAAPVPQGSARARTPYEEQPVSQAEGGKCELPPPGSAPAGPQLCIYGNGPSSVRSGDEVSYTVQLCSPVRNETWTTLRFSTGQEHEVLVGPVRAPAWTWSARHVFPQGPHERLLRAGYCLRWQTTWDTRDDQGELVEPGAYELTQRVELDGDPRSVRMRVEVFP